MSGHLEVVADRDGSIGIVDDDEVVGGDLNGRSFRQTERGPDAQGQRRQQYLGHVDHDLGRLGLTGATVQ